MEQGKEERSVRQNTEKLKKQGAEELKERFCRRLNSGEGAEEKGLEAG